MPSLMFYDKPVALNKDAHKKVKIGEVKGFSFAAKTNSVLLTAVEFIEAAKEYPIVFTKAGERIVPIALLGMRNDENLFVDKAGGWNASYIPAFVRRYPFVLAETGTDQLAVCIDEGYKGFNAKDGTPLFNDNGTNSPLLDNVLNFMNDYQVQYARTNMMIAELTRLNLLTEMNAKADLAAGKSYLLNGLMIVDETRLMALGADDASKLLKSGALGSIYAHLISLTNMRKLVDLLAKSEGAQKAA
jgi:hypothetical protein